MQELIASLQKMRFDFEVVLEQRRGILDLPFSGMDKSGSAVCEFFIKGECLKENLCPFRHSSGEKSVVCKHWLRGLCKRGDQCEFLHEYDMTKMPRCYFYSKYGECSKRDCPFLHIDSEVKIQDCPWYDQGFCKNGPLCKNKHTRKVMCVNYLAGFCPEGTECKFSHPNNEFTEWNMETKEMDMHSQYPLISKQEKKFYQGYKALDKVTCFKVYLIV
ncbi:putative cleavage and polyadenylation specificity factor subunit 4-like protein isoform X1 [Pristis pectinata]|uniref:putative cleavage and polyadenylation specificity factor subunit 4-like protein isoform X1 n=1 Tax=Pristis pectinata TaxID=685728 RepID=UPI00223DCFC6|nr:putative cleavage and polyadenylation specificity factor subunit 4-like protein isoform X1 [Pristis pectinata]